MPSPPPTTVSAGILGEFWGQYIQFNEIVRSRTPPNHGSSVDLPFASTRREAWGEIGILSLKHHRRYKPLYPFKIANLGRVV
jgi:hypothetical protein